MNSSRRLRYAVLIASVTAVVGGGALALQQTGSPPSGHAGPGLVTAQNASVNDDDCKTIHDQLGNKQDDDVDVDDALKCDQREFAALEKKRLSGKTDNHVRLSATCTIVNKRLAAGDPDVDEDLATACRNRELFAIDTDVSNEIGSSDRLTSMCIGKKKLDKTHDAPDFEKDACSDKEFGTQPLPVSEKPVDPRPAPSDPAPSNAPSVVPSPSPSFDIQAQCGPIDDALKNKQSFDADLGVKCVNAESGLSADGTHAVTLGKACSFIDLRAFNGDLDMPANVVIACEHLLQLQLTNNSGTLDGATDICKAVRKQQSDGTTVDADLAKICAGEPA